MAKRRNDDHVTDYATGTIWKSSSRGRIEELLEMAPEQHDLVKRAGLVGCFSQALPKVQIQAVADFARGYNHKDGSVDIRGARHSVTAETVRAAFALPAGSGRRSQGGISSNRLKHMFSSRTKGNPYSLEKLNAPYVHWIGMMRLIGELLLGKSRPNQVSTSTMWVCWCYWSETVKDSGPWNNDAIPSIKPDWAQMILEELTTEILRLKTHLNKHGSVDKRYSCYCGTAVTLLLTQLGYSAEPHFEVDVAQHNAEVGVHIVDAAGQHNAEVGVHIVDAAEEQPQCSEHNVEVGVHMVDVTEEQPQFNDRGEEHTGGLEVMEERLIAKYQSEMWNLRDNLREDYESTIADLKAQLETAQNWLLERQRAELEAAHKADMEQLRAELEAANKANMEQLRAELKAARDAEWERDMLKLQAALEGEWERDCEKLNAAHEARVEQLRAQLKARHQAEAEQKEESEAAHKAEMEQLKAELKAAHDAEWEQDMLKLKAAIEREWERDCEKLNAAHETRVEQLRAQLNAGLKAEVEQLKAHCKLEVKLAKLQVEYDQLRCDQPDQFDLRLLRKRHIRS